ncbi:CYTH domain-containing protein [Corynebacterium caspium]|uniref:CYTH domain-containing protein n=1 Tax=Corynebacterium caspium TaxID=234828 RepID=UPI000378CDD9|nr:CYTH domain-containing protein [Corynebacterium caspium]WKD59662.1 CYTH domain protein [Corynebacterium caspium DSM 44850]
MALSRSVEVETTFWPAPNTATPDLQALPGITEIASTKTFQLEATYFDTPDLRLSRAGISLRYRTGGHDSGWHLKRPVSTVNNLGEQANQRQEITLSFKEYPASTEVPPPLLDEVFAYLMGQSLTPVSKLETTRTETLLAAADATIKAAFCDDQVISTALLPGGVLKQWREWELELAEPVEKGSQGEKLLDGFNKLASDLGAHLPEIPSKFQNSIAEALATAPTPLPPKRWQPATKYDLDFAQFINSFQAHHQKLLVLDGAVRGGDNQASAQMREEVGVLVEILRYLASLFPNPAAEISELGTLLSELDTVLAANDFAQQEQAALMRLLARPAASLVDYKARKRLINSTLSRSKRHQKRQKLGLEVPPYMALLSGLENLAANFPIPSAEIRQNLLSGLFTNLEHTWAQFNETERVLLQELNNPKTDISATMPLLGTHLQAAFQLQAQATVLSDITDSKVFPSEKLLQSCKYISYDIKAAIGALNASTLILRRSDAARRHHEDSFAYGLLYEAARHLALYRISRAEDTGDIAAKAWHKLQKTHHKLVNKAQKTKKGKKAKKIKKPKKTKAAKL